MLHSLFASALLIPTLALLVISLLSLFLERKLIGIAQKRLGISFMGRNGWAHLPADLVKFWLKYSGRHKATWLTSATGVVGAILAYLAWSLVSCVFFLGDGCSTPVDFWDYQLLVYFGYANLSTLLMFCVVAGTRSKYATVASARILLVSVYMEVFFVLVFLCVYTHAGGFALEEVSSAARTHTLAISLPPLALFLCIYALFEAKRAPFDHSEAESELVAGHMVEFGGRALLFFYMCEYTHLVFCLFLVVSLCFGAAFPSLPSVTYLYPFELLVIGAS